MQLNIDWPDRSGWRLNVRIAKCIARVTGEGMTEASVRIARGVNPP